MKSLSRKTASCLAAASLVAAVLIVACHPFGGGDDYIPSGPHQDTTSVACPIQINPSAQPALTGLTIDSLNGRAIKAGKLFCPVALANPGSNLRIAATAKFDCRYPGVIAWDPSTHNVCNTLGTFTIKVYDRNSGPIGPVLNKTINTSILSGYAGDSPLTARAIVADWFYPNQYFGPYGPTGDSLDMSFTSLNTPASLFTVWPMKVDTKQGYLTGPTIVDAGQQGSWKLYPHWPASGYDISWNINGFPHPANGDTMLTETISGPGPRWLNAVYTTVDGVSKTVSTLVYTRLRASISGPTTVPTSGDYTWTAVGTTGVEPFGPPTYAWSKQDDGGSNTSLGSGSSATVTVDETTPGFTIELTVSFPGFLNGNASQHVAGPCGGFMCLRAPAGSTKPRASPAGRTKH